MATRLVIRLLIFKLGDEIRVGMPRARNAHFRSHLQQVLNIDVLGAIEPNVELAAFLDMQLHVVDLWLTP